MSRKIHQSTVEHLVIAYLKRLDKTNKVRTQTAILSKASKLIQITLSDPCCPPAENVILGRQENFFTIQIAALLNNIDVRKWRESLERAKKLLDDILDKPCCYLTQEIQGIIRTHADAGAAEFTFVNLNYMGLSTPTYVSGNNLPQTAGQTGVFTILNGVHTVTVYGDIAQAGLKWRVTDSEGTVQEAPYVGGDSQDFFNVKFNFNGMWIIEILPV